MVCFVSLRRCFTWAVECINLATPWELVAFFLTFDAKIFNKFIQKQTTTKKKKIKWNNVNVEHKKIVCIAFLLLLLSDQCANCMCSSFTPRIVDREKIQQQTIVVMDKSEKTNLMHILYHAPFALNSFNVGTVVVVGFFLSAPQYSTSLCHHHFFLLFRLLSRNVSLFYFRICFNLVYLFIVFTEY